VRITDIEVFPLNLPMKQNFSISGGSVGNQKNGAPHVYVKILNDYGEEGWGEARPSPRWSYETQETVVTTIDNYLKPALIGENAEDLKLIYKKMNQEIASAVVLGQPIAKAAIDMAIHDLIGKHTNRKITDLWHGTVKDTIQLSYLISTDNVEEAFKKGEYAQKNGYTGVDVKIGLDPKKNIEILEAVKESASNMYFRVDANQAFNLPEAIEMVKEMEKIGVDVFEQPLPANDLMGHAEIRRKSSIPIALDESVWGPSTLLQALKMESCDVIVIKATKMGGLKKAMICGEIAREANIGMLGGGLTESKLGLTASAHLFNYLDIDTPVDLNGPMFLEDDPVGVGPDIEHGNVKLTDIAGIGCLVEPDKIEKYRIRL